MFTHINLLHCPPLPVWPISGLMGARRGHHEAGNGGCWWWPAAWKANAHPSWRWLSSSLRWPDTGYDWMLLGCVCWCVYCEVNNADCCNYGLNTERALSLVIVCEKVEKLGVCYHSSSERCDLIFPVYMCVLAQYCLAVKHRISGAVGFDTPQLYFVWERRFGIFFSFFWIFPPVCGA